MRWYRWQFFLGSAGDYAAQAAGIPKDMWNTVLGLVLSGLLAAQPAAKSGPLHGRIVVVDPGHGGKDGGASGNGVGEAGLVLELSQKLAAQLRAQGARVVMTRTTWHNLLDAERGLKNRQRANLAARVALAEKHKADVYVSVHANKAPGYPSATGGQVFLGRRPSEASRTLASCVDKYLSAATQSRRPIDSRVELYLMEHLRMPSVLVEVGFLSNSAETRRMLDEAYQEKVAKSIADGILCYVQETGLPRPQRPEHAHRRALVPLPHRIAPQRPAHKVDVDTFARAEHF